jgi:anti-anti-sigma factor
VAVVDLPEQIDVANAAQVRRQLAAALASGAAVVIADMTGTTFTDTLGVRALVLAHQHAVARGAELRVVLVAKPVLRVLSILGVDRYLAIYPNLSAARSAEAAPPWTAAGVVA